MHGGLVDEELVEELDYTEELRYGPTPKTYVT